MTCLGENTEKDITPSVPIRKVKGVGKRGTKLQKPYISDYNLLVAEDLWKAHKNLVNNLAKSIHKIKCTW